MRTWQKVELNPFLSTLSLRRATQPRKTEVPGAIISIHALLAESDHDQGANDQKARQISIHALLAESDLEQSASYNAYLEISIHALLAESDDNGRISDTENLTFLSTLSLRRATADSVSKGTAT